MLSRVAPIIAGCVLLISACGGDPPPPASPDGPAPSASATAAPPTTTAGPTASLEPGPTLSASPIPSSSLGIRWLPLAATGELTSSDVVADAVAAGQSLVAVGTYDDGALAGAAAWYTVDGTAWQRAQVERAESAVMEDVTIGPSGFVAVGYDYGGDELVPAVWSSADGISWQMVTDEDLRPGQLTAVAAGARGYVALGFDPADGDGLVWTSVDGRAWDAPVGVPAFGVQPSVNDVIARGDGYLAYGSSGADERAAIWRSRDGVAWQVVDPFPSIPGSSVMGLAASGELLVAVGADYSGDAARALAWVSTDGQDWQRALDVGAGQLGEMLAVVPVGIGFMAVGAAGGEGHGGFGAAVWSSPDGFVWQREADDTSFANARMSEVLRAGPGLVALGESALDPAGEDVRPQVWLGVSR